MQEIIVTKEYDGQRLNKFLGKYLDHAPQSFIYKMLRKKNIKLNNGKATGNEILSVNDSVKIFMTDDTICKFRKDGKLPNVNIVEKKEGKDLVRVIEHREDCTLDILFEDEDILVLNKPTNVLSQKSQPHDYTLNEQILDYYHEKKDVDPLFVPSVCNRLDRNTSGIILAGMSFKGSRSLSAMLKDRSLDKYYITIVSGKVTEKKVVKGYLAKLTTHNKVSVFSSEAQAKSSGAEKVSYIETQYEPLAFNNWNGKPFTLLKVKLITGKTHQIRAHLYASGYPIVGDGKYGDKHINNMMKKEFHLKHQLLHAFCITFPMDVLELSPGLDNKEFKADPPEQFRSVITEIFHLDVFDIC